jgi:hypothetical protein
MGGLVLAREIRQGWARRREEVGTREGKVLALEIYGPASVKKSAVS